MIKFVNENNIKSTSDYLIVTDLRNKYTYIFRKIMEAGDNFTSGNVL